MPLASRFWLAPLLFVLIAAVGCSEPTAEEKLAKAEETLGQATADRDRAVQLLERRDKELAKAQEAQEKARATADEAEARVRQVEARLQEYATDELVFRKVQTKLLQDPKLANVAISASVRDGVVELTGNAPDADTRERASEVAGGVLGVRNVRNTIQLPPAAVDPSEAP